MLGNRALLRSNPASKPCATARSLPHGIRSRSTIRCASPGFAGRFPARAMAVSSLWHVAAVFVMALPIWGAIHWTPRASHRAGISYHLRFAAAGTAAGYAAFNARTHPRPPPSRVPAGKPNEPLPPEGADAYNPRQTILSQPQRITHPRQTLIQPDASPDPPKVVPQLPEYRRVGQSRLRRRRRNCKSPRPHSRPF